MQSIIYVQRKQLTASQLNLLHVAVIKKESEINRKKEIEN